MIHDRLSNMPYITCGWTVIIIGILLFVFIVMQRLLSSQVRFPKLSRMPLRARSPLQSEQ